MRLLISSAFLLVCAGPVLASDMALMVGLRSVMAASIRDYGYGCRDVTDFEPVGYAGDGEVLKVFCAAGSGPGAETRTYKVVAYMDGEFEALPWPRDNAIHPRVDVGRRVANRPPADSREKQPQLPSLE